MSRKNSLSKSNSLMNMDLTMRKSMTIKNDKNMETSINVSSSSHTNKQKNECSSEKLIQSSSTISKPTHKHKHRCHHHRHHRQHIINKIQKPVTIIREMPNEEASPTDANQDSESKTIKRNIPLQPVENKLVSQRKAPASETQVGNYSSLVCNQCLPAIYNTSNVQEIICQEDCCIPPATVSCTCSSCMVSQSNPVICIPQQQQQQQQQIFVCDDPCLSAQPFLDVPQTPIQQPSTIIIYQQQQQQQQQQPQIQVQPIQILQGPATTSSVQYIQIASATPQTIQASPQILYQRPYDPIVLPVQNQQVAIAQNPVISLSQPSYAPARQIQTRPRMFQNALIQIVANRAGVPVLASPPSGLQMVQSPIANSPFAQPRVSTANRLLINNPRQSTSLPIVPLTPGGLLIPFEVSDRSQPTPGGNLSRRVSFPPRLGNFEDMRQRLQQRAQVLASLKQQNPNINQSSARLPLLLADPPVPRPSPLIRSSTAPISLPLPSMNSQPTFSVPSSTLPNAYTSSLPNASFPSNPIVPPPVIQSKTPYIGGNLGNVSDSSSSSTRSSASSTAPTRSAPSGLIYSQPFTGGSTGGSGLGGAASTYQSIRP